VDNRVSFQVIATMRSEQTFTKTFQARFGSVVRSQRLGAGLSQEELAHRSGLHRTYVTDVERGARNPSLNSIKKLSDALGVPLSGLFALVEAQSGSDGSPDSTVVRAPASRRGRVNVLVAADRQVGIEPLLRSLNGDLLHTIHAVYDGSETLDYIFCTGPYKKRDMMDTPDCVFLDLGLSKVNSLEILSRMRGNPLTSSIPVVALVTQPDQNLDKARQLGVSEFIAAPVDIAKLTRALSQVGLKLSVGSNSREV